MKRNLLCFFLIFSVVLFSGFSSAGWFGDLFGKITGNAVSIAPELSDSDFVKKLNWYMLEREGSSSSVNSRTAWLETHSREELIVEFFKSQEFQEKYSINAMNDSQFINFIYNKFYSRSPDSGGYAFYLNALSDGMSREEMVADFSDESELKSSFEAFTYTTPSTPNNSTTPSTPNNSTTPSTPNNSTAQGCVDSDGGYNYSVKGVTKISNSSYSDSDYCRDSKVLVEYLCQNSFEISHDSYFCNDGCSNGACLTKTPIKSCDDVIYKIKNPSDYEFNDIIFNKNYNSSYSYEEWINGTRYSVNSYQASWGGSEGSTYHHISFNVLVFNNISSKLLNQWIKERTDYSVCTITSHSQDDGENYYYICNWDILSNSQQEGNYQHQSREIFWVNGNKLFQINTFSGKSLSDEEIGRISLKKINDFLNDLKNNQNKFVGWDAFDLDWTLRGQIIELFDSGCNSEVEQPVNENNQSCTPYWQCKLEPVVCPPHGYQTKTCVDYSCNMKDIEQQISCSPGVCSGCIMPRWFESKSENKCVPYGFRFEQQTGWKIEEVIVDKTDSEGLNVAQANQYDGVDLIVYPDNTALLTLEIGRGILKNFSLEIGKEYDWNFDEPNSIDYTLLVDNIVYDSQNYDQSYIKVSIRAKGTYQQQSAEIINAYCDIDGQIKEQKKKNSDGSWVKCQNNYECDSNICSGGECVEVNDMLKEVKGYKSVGIKILCKMADIFGINDYESCVAGYFT